MTSDRKRSRRDFMIGSSAAAIGAFLAPTVFGSSQLQAAPRLLDPNSIRQFNMTLTNPLDPGFPGVRINTAVNSAPPITLTILEHQHVFGLQTNGSPIQGRAWGYALGSSVVPTYPGPTIDVPSDTRLNVTYVNGLAGIPNRMPVDTTLDWANPGGLGGLAPVPVVTHLHGARSETRSDGLPDAWSSPGERYTGRLFQRQYTYENRQEAAHMWYHDHARGITRTNVYMGLAGLYILRDDNEKRLQRTNVMPSGSEEVALVIQDRQFTQAGELFYPASDPTTPGLPKPTHLPEFFGDTILVNGAAWPKMRVEKRKYRFRVLNGSDSRFYALKVQAEVPVRGAPSRPVGARLKWLVIGNELGFLNAPVEAYWRTHDTISEPNMLLIGPGERYDVVIDFSDVPAGTRMLMWNDAAAPYNGSPADGVDYVAPTAGTTDRVMAFDVVPRNSNVPNASVSLATRLRVGSPDGPLTNPDTSAPMPRRRILLFEGVDSFGRLQTMIGPVDRDPVTGRQGTLNFADPITERPRVGQPEIWEFHNTTADAHPIHMHLVDFRIIERQPFTATQTPKRNTDGSEGAIISDVATTGPSVPVDPWQSGKKDTVVSYPGHITRILVNFTRAGEYVYHCHILSHEDHEMMRPFQVMPLTVAAN